MTTAGCVITQKNAVLTCFLVVLHHFHILAIKSEFLYMFETTSVQVLMYL